jgi:hypothetical protein
VTVGGFRFTAEGVENVSMEDVDGDGPFAGVRPNAGGGGTVDDGEVLSVIGERALLRIDLTSDSVCEGEIEGAGGTGLRGGEGCKVGGGLNPPNGMRGARMPHLNGLLGGSDGSDEVGG